MMGMQIFWTGLLMLFSGVAPCVIAAGFNINNEPYWLKATSGLLMLASLPLMIIGALIAIWS